MTIEFTRTDDRFIHGQVTTGWARQMDINKIALVNNGIANNATLKKLQQLSAGNDVEVEFYSMEEAKSAIRSDHFCKDGKYFLLLETPVDLLELVEEGLSIVEVNLGNLHFEPGKKKITNWVFVNQEQLDALKQLDQSGIRLSAQWVVASDAIDVNNWLKKKK